jgi:hypothetical protein
MAAAKVVNARWVGFSPARLECPGHPADGQLLTAGETVVAMSAGEAEASGHWEVVGKQPATPAAKTKRQLAADKQAAAKQAEADEKAADVADAEQDRQQADQEAEAAELRSQAADAEAGD